MPLKMHKHTLPCLISSHELDAYQRVICECTSYLAGNTYIFSAPWSWSGTAGRANRRRSGVSPLLALSSIKENPSNQRVFFRYTPIRELSASEELATYVEREPFE